MRRRLFAIDMDGTLLRTDGSVDATDCEAIARALEQGVIVTLATGRVATGALPFARQLGLVAPLVCADGGLVIDPTTAQRLEARALELEHLDRVMAVLEAHRLTRYVVHHDSVHCDESGRRHAELVSVWTREITVHARLSEVDVWRRAGEVALTVGLGPHASVLEANAAIEREYGTALDRVHFRVDRAMEMSALLVRPKGCTKGAALERVARGLGVTREDTAAVGDWYNDVSMFQWVARSFAMAQAPEAVRSAATETLRASAVTGGGVAEALGRWLGSVTT